ncbi:hypothetical protein BC937DRAFT_93129 [Endogone sp. FLAS-F59071]|nr:hypothetical protein BC937DRAFT_93129 [Endogone sp. FLAS-F59071]|eukprot:RUS21271.1 hypothetical protein BC937DRAFT_93129 [Endogone sp. FLAS-F59071]
MTSGKPTTHLEPPPSSAGGPIPIPSTSRTRIINVTITRGGATVVEQKLLITSVQQTASKPRDSFDIVQCYHAFLLDRDVSTPVATFKSLVEFVKHSQASTMSEFMQTLEDAAQQIQAISSADAGAWRTSHLLSTAQDAEGKSPIHSQCHHKATIATLAGCDLFMRFVARNSHDAANFETYRTLLISRGEIILEKAAAARDKAAETGSQFIRDNAVILVHSYSRIVMRLLERAAAQNKRFKVYVTESRPTSEGLTAAAALRASGIPATVILDSAVGYVMDKVDLVLVGAEGVVENGGVINQETQTGQERLDWIEMKVYCDCRESRKEATVRRRGKVLPPMSLIVMSLIVFSSQLKSASYLQVRPPLPAQSIRSAAPVARDSHVWRPAHAPPLHYRCPGGRSTCRRLRGGKPQRRLHAAGPHHAAADRPGSAYTEWCI